MSGFNMSEHFLGSNKGFETLANSVQNPLAWTAAHSGRELGESGPPSKTIQATKENLPQIVEGRGWMT